jgi:hypothetical protein
LRVLPWRTLAQGRGQNHGDYGACYWSKERLHDIQSNMASVELSDMSASVQAQISPQSYWLS